MAMDWVRASINPKKRKKCHTWVTKPRRTMLPAYRTPAMIIICRPPYRSPSQPLTGANRAPTR